MAKVSQVGEQLKRRSREKEQQLQTEFRESLERLEQSLTELSSNKLTQIESDISEKIEQIEEFGKEKIQRLVNANHKLYKETIEDEKAEWTEELLKWRKLLIILLPTALIFGLIVGVLATLQFSPDEESLTISESKIVTGRDGTQWVQVEKIPNVTIIKKVEE
jgi:hypothetical protein